MTNVGQFSTHDIVGRPSTIEQQCVKITFYSMSVCHFPLHYINNQMRRTIVPRLLQAVTARNWQYETTSLLRKEPVEDEKKGRVICW